MDHAGSLIASASPLGRLRPRNGRRKASAVLVLAAATGLAVAATCLATPETASAQGFRSSCQRYDEAMATANAGQVHLSGTPAQRLMNEIAKQTSSGPMSVDGGLIFKGDGQVVILWIRGEMICNNGLYDRDIFDRAERAVFGIDA